MAAQREVVRANKLDSCYLRPIAFYGSEKMGVSPKGAKVHVAIAAWPWGAYLGPEALEKGIRVKTSSFARHHINVTMARAKFAGTYANSILANQEATMDGYDEALVARRRWLRRGGLGRKPVRRQGRQALRAGAHVRLGRHHARLDHHARQRPRDRSAGQALDARRRLHRRRGILHRHRGRGHAHTRARQPRHRQRRVRTDHTQAAVAVLRCGQWQELRNTNPG